MKFVCFSVFMRPIHELINKIKWDPNEKSGAYSLLYYDRMQKCLIEFRFEEIQSIEDGFIKIFKEQELISIPFHRIKQVKKDGTIIWERKISS